MHRSKGLEWPLVILPGLEEGVFPRLSSEIEDERRLFFVAATRAEKELLLIAPKDARLANHVSAMESEIPDSREMLASRFVYEMHLSIAQKVSDAMTGGLPGNSLPVVRENLDKFQGYIKKIG
jgi:DNA helicase-2/ATP-dependent DNA helicase PcrA